MQNLYNQSNGGLKMPILNTFIELLPYVILALVVIVIIIFYIFWEKKRREPIPDDDYIKNILEALGDISNIINAKKEHKRIQIELKEPNKVDVNKLKALAISAFLNNQRITLLIHEQGDRLLNHIKTQRKEER